MAASVVNATDGVIVPNQTPGVTPFKVTATIATTSLDDVGDDVLLFAFPANSYFLTSSLVFHPSDMDTGTNLVFDVGIGDSDGVIDTVLINDNAGGQTGTVAFADEVTTGEGFVDCGGKYLICSVVTAAQTAAAGTIEVAGLYAGGLVPIVSS